jgi:hypothetical protein
MSLAALPHPSLNASHRSTPSSRDDLPDAPAAALSDDRSATAGLADLVAWVIGAGTTVLLLLAPGALLLAEYALLWRVLFAPWAASAGLLPN